MAWHLGERMPNPNSTRVRCRATVVTLPPAGAAWKSGRLVQRHYERCFLGYLKLLSGERISRECLQVQGIDKYFFTQNAGYVTTFLRDVTQFRCCGFAPLVQLGKRSFLARGDRLHVALHAQQRHH